MGRDQPPNTASRLSRITESLSSQPVYIPTALLVMIGMSVNRGTGGSADTVRDLTRRF